MVAIAYEKFELPKESKVWVALVSVGALLGALVMVGTTLVLLKPRCGHCDGVSDMGQSKMKTFTLFAQNKLNWYEALTDCYRRGMRLASVESEGEHQLLVNLIFSTVPELDYYSNFWLAGTDLAQDGEYVWMTTGAPLNFTSWQSNEPNQRTRNGETEHCILMWKDYGFWWNDDLCSLSNFYVCEDKLTPSYNRTTPTSSVSLLTKSKL